MLKLNAAPTFTSTVKIPSPTGDATIKVTFKHMTKDAYADFIKKERELARSDEDALMDIVEGWVDVDAEFNRENVKLLCQNYHGAGTAIVEAYVTQLTQVRRGN
jgi:hypothetical protein